MKRVLVSWAAVFTVASEAASIEQTMMVNIAIKCGLAVVSQDVVPVEAEAGGWRSVRGRGVWAVEVVVVHPRLQLSGSVL